jgi:hypothetical protein
MRMIYQCEKFGSYYRDKSLAELCEGFVLPVPAFSVGQEVGVQTRYDGIQFHTIQEIKLHWNSVNSMVADLEPGQKEYERRYEWAKDMADSRAIGATLAEYATGKRLGIPPNMRTTATITS